MRIIASLALLLAASAAIAAPAANWRELNFLRYKKIDFTVNAAQIDINSQAASSMLYRPISANERNKSQLQWQWQISKTNVPATDLARDNGDDRLLGIYVFFTREDEGDNAELTSNGNYLAYVWGGKNSVGSIITSADKKGKIIVIRAHDAAQKSWAKANASYISDFKREFGYNGYPAFIAISADSDDSNGQTTAAIKNIEFTDQP